MKTYYEFTDESGCTRVVEISGHSFLDVKLKAHKEAKIGDSYGEIAPCFLPIPSYVRIKHIN